MRWAFDSSVILVVIHSSAEGTPLVRSVDVDPATVAERNQLEICVFAGAERAKGDAEGYMFVARANVRFVQVDRFRLVVAMSMARRHRDTASWLQERMSRVRKLGAVISRLAA